MKRMRFFADLIKKVKTFLLIFVVLFTFSSTLSDKVFAQTTGGLTQADVLRWKNYADVSFADPAYSVYKEIMYKLADQVYQVYPEVTADQGFQYILAAGPKMSGVTYGNGATSRGLLSEAESETRTVTSGGSMSATILATLEQMKSNESAFNGQKNGTITATQAQQKIDNAAQKQKTSVASETNKTIDNCSFGLNFSMSACAGDFFLWFVKSFLLEIAGFMVWASANMLNYSIQVGILNFSQWAPDSLYPIWIIVRQIISLFIVFAGLWLGFMYIINKGDKFKHYIPWVIIFALFVNFSYPITRTVIDISNIVSLNIYASAVGTNALTANSASQNTAGAMIMNNLGLQGLVMSAQDDATNNKITSNLTKVGTVPGALMAVIFVAYAAYIFFMITWLIIARTASLVFLIIASPLLFVDSVIPKLGDQAVKLRQIFFEQLAVGPVFAIMLALTLKFLEVFSSVAKPGGSGGDATIVEFFNLTMMLIMLHIMYKVTKSLSGTIGQTFTNYVGKVGGFAMGAAGGVALGGAGMLARGTVGRGAAALRDSKWVTSNQGNFIGRRVLDMSNSVAKSSFDGRNSSFVQTGAGKLGLSRGMGMIGTGSKMGFEERAEAREKDRIARLQHIGTNKKNTYKDDGSLDKTKGSLIETGEAKKMRDDYIKNVANDNSSVFASKKENTQAKDDLAYKLQEAKTVAEKNQKDEMMKRYSGFGDTEQDKKNKEAFFKAQKIDDQRRLKDSDIKKALDEYKSFEDTSTGKSDKLEFYNKQDAEIQVRLDEYKNKVEQEKQEKIIEREERKSSDKASIEATRLMADNTKALTDAIQASRNGVPLQTQQVVPVLVTTDTGSPVVPTASNQITNNNQDPSSPTGVVTRVAPKPNPSSGGVAKNYNMAEEELSFE